ncbi:hypothetical protein SNEBB_008842 [Seison nebaliae]|nr:hypothetical protein SNEBB_008842 [Seison nebaliae]
MICSLVIRFDFFVGCLGLLPFMSDLPGDPVILGNYRLSEVCKAISTIQRRPNLTLPYTLATTNHQILKKLGQGGEGSAYLVKNEHDELFVTKLSRKPHAVMIEYNAESAFRLYPVGHWHAFNTLGVSYGRLWDAAPRKFIFKYKPIKANLMHKQGAFCIDTTYIEGKTLSKMRFVPRVPGLSVKKQYYAFIIMILRQLQAVHFTTNSHSLFHHPYFGRRTYANHHSDMNSANIICTLKRFHTHSYYVPTLIDYGLSIKYIFFDKYDFQIYAYNQQLTNDEGITTNNRIHADRIFNRGQRHDFCALAAITVIYFQYNFRILGGKLSTLCSSAADQLFFNLQKHNAAKSPMQYLPLLMYFGVTPLFHLIHQFLLMSLRFGTYKSWIRLVSYFDPDVIHY